MLISLRNVRWYQQWVAFGRCCGSLSLQLWSPCVVPSKTEKYGILFLHTLNMHVLCLELFTILASKGDKLRKC